MKGPIQANATPAATMRISSVSRDMKTPRRRRGGTARVPLAVSRVLSAAISLTFPSQMDRCRPLGDEGRPR
jgi:hypothetical protein